MKKWKLLTTVCSQEIAGKMAEGGSVYVAGGFTAFISIHERADCFTV